MKKIHINIFKYSKNDEIPIQIALQPDRKVNNQLIMIHPPNYVSLYYVFPRGLFLSDQNKRDTHTKFELI